MNDNAAEFQPVMPFVVVASKGGPYDDQAFCAGYEMGQLDAALCAAPRLHQVTIRAANVDQADLIAMRRGYTSTAQPPSECGTWTFVEFEPMHPIGQPGEEP